MQHFQLEVVLTSALRRGPGTPTSVPRRGTRALANMLDRTPPLCVKTGLPGEPRQCGPVTPIAAARAHPYAPRVGLAGLAHRGHVEAVHAQRRHGAAGEVVAPLPRQRGDGRTGLGDPVQHRDRALVEPEVVDRAGDLAVFD